jgi:hypothetical protein
VVAALALAACSKAPRPAAHPAKSPSVPSVPSVPAASGDTGQLDTGLFDTPTPSSVRPTTSVSCGTVTAAEVNAALGTAVGAPSINRSNPPVSLCTFGGGTPFRTVIVRAQGGQDPTGFALEKDASDANQQPTTAVTGYGDEAYTTTVTAPGGVTVTTLVARKGDVEILITARSPLEQVGALMRQVLARVP